MDDDLFTSLFPQSALDPFPTPSTTWDSVTQKVWGVGELVAFLQGCLERDFCSIWVEGEVSNFHRPASGHVYFTLKDPEARLRAVLFRGQASRLPFRLEDGQHILCLGRLNVYPARGELQLVAEAVEPLGTGALQLAFEQLKERLASQGLFDPAHKQPLPLLPKRVFILTSASGAALHDFVHAARSRSPSARLVLCPASVQGASAPGELISALLLVQEVAEEGDVVLVTRGGGSLEDLWAFNDEDLARAIFAFPLPVVSAVGHEVDFTITDFVADRRAPTPTAAAQVLFPDKEELLGRLQAIKGRLLFSAKDRISNGQQRILVLRHRLRDPRQRLMKGRLRLEECNRRLSHEIRRHFIAWGQRLSGLNHGLMRIEPSRRLDIAKAGLKSLDQRLVRAYRVHTANRREHLRRVVEHLDAVSPLAVLRRGYSLVYRLSDDQLVRKAEQVAKGERLLIRLEEGTILCRVTESPGPDRKGLGKNTPPGES